MPIGKNIKKDTLIPETGKVKAKKATKRKKVIKREKTSTKEIVEEKFEEKVTQSLEISAEALNLGKKISEGKYITEQEYQERQRLKAKFEEEIQGYKGKTLQLITFPLGNEKYAVQIDAIKEVVPTPEISRIPHAPSFIKGVASIRGTVMVIMDLTSKFELDKADENKELPAYTMVINGVSFNAGMLVKEVPTTLKVNGDDIVSSAGLLSNTALDETFIKGLIKTDKDMVIYLDISELIEEEDVRVMTKALEQ